MVFPYGCILVAVNNGKRLAREASRREDMKRRENKNSGKKK